MSRPGSPWSGLGFVKDPRWVKFFYLDLTLESLIRRLHGLTFTFVPDSRDIPFNAQIRGYKGALDSDGSLWLLKAVGDPDVLPFRLCELAYYLDVLLHTLSAPTLLVALDGVFYRATKVVVEATQIDGYNYLEEPFRRVLAIDLINRWLMFDEDRNPNNYMVIHTVAGEPLVVAIDFNHADLWAEEMKITGNHSQFGWHRSEKTRFLTLLKPEHFDVYTLADFEPRLSLMMGIDLERLRKICVKLFQSVTDNPTAAAERVARNLDKRRRVIDEYFRRSFTGRKAVSEAKDDARYEGMGKQFVEFYKKKR